VQLSKVQDKLLTILNSMPLVIAVVDSEWKVKKVSDAAVSLASSSQENMVNSRLGAAFRCLNSLDDPRGCGFGPQCEHCMIRSSVLSTFTTGKAHTKIEARLPIQREGSVTHYWMLVSTSRIDGDQVLVILEDITEHKEITDRLRQEIKEKDILLKEIHHRVKNNLSVVAGLLRLQSEEIETVAQAKTALLESQNRVYTMSLVHEKLYQGKSYTHIDIESFINSLINELGNLYASDKAITYAVKVEITSLDISRAIPAGLILNELIANALEHGFKDRRSGKIDISLTVVNNNQGSLRVSDDGVGIPEELDIEQTGSLGLKLVNLLAEQLEGTLQIISDKGSLFHIVFPLTETV
jgi:two-component sensor histidine kinase